MKKFEPLVVLIASFTLFVANAAQSNQGQLEIKVKDKIFENSTAFQRSHASTLVHTNDDKFLVAWFAGEGEGKNDVSIWSSKGAVNEWSTPRKIAKVNELPHWNPVLFTGEDGLVYLFFKVGKSPSSWKTWMQTSSDNGDSWSAAVEIDDQENMARGPVRSKPILLSNHTWLAGASDEKQNKWNVFADISTNQGESWSATPFTEIDRSTIKDRGVIQPTVWESQPGHVHMMTRSTEGSIYRSDSEDNGKHWTPLYKTILPNNNSGIDVAKMDTGALVLVFNNLATDGIRTPLNVALSIDNGDTWPQVLGLETAQGGEFSYPAVIAVGDKIYGTYTWNRTSIVFWEGQVVGQ